MAGRESFEVLASNAPTLLKKMVAPLLPLASDQRSQSSSISTYTTDLANIHGATSTTGHPPILQHTAEQHKPKTRDESEAETFRLFCGKTETE
jgi:hypothetical protein